jgi:hypothetical protein
MAQVVTFDPDALRIIEVDVGGDNEIQVREIYSEWKDWILADPAVRLGYPQALRVVGGDTISATRNLGSTFFLCNGWRLRPAERTHHLTLVGNLFTDPYGDSVFVPTLGAHQVTCELSTSNLMDQTVAGSALTSEQEAQLLAMWRTMGLDASNPMVVAPTYRNVPADGSLIAQTIEEEDSVVTVTRTV